MNDAFEKKVKAAAVAGWWVVLIAIGFLTLACFLEGKIARQGT
jgi:hypothetical protein